MKDAYVAGIGMTVFGKSQTRGVRSYAEEAARQALEESGLEASSIDRVYFSNAIGGLITGQEMIRGQAALRHLGLDGVPIINVENACASGSTAISLALQDIRSGLAENVLVVGAERMSHEDKHTTFDAIARAIDLDEAQELKDEYDLGQSASGSLFMEIYAHEAKDYSRRTGATARDFADVAAKSRANGALNPRAQYRQAVNAGEVLTSRVISDPLTLLMCSPIGDGSAAVVLSSNLTMPNPDIPAARILASEIATATHDGENVVTRAAKRAYQRADVRPQDICLAEVHDAAASAELALIEQLQLCAEGEAVSLLRNGDTHIGGRIPINTSGGLISRGHPIGATGVAQVVEIVEQLRGQSAERQVQGANVGLTQNSGGHMWEGPAVACVTILARS